MVNLLNPDEFQQRPAHMRYYFLILELETHTRLKTANLWLFRILECISHILFDEINHWDITETLDLGLHFTASYYHMPLFGVGFKLQKKNFRRIWMFCFNYCLPIKITSLFYCVLLNGTRQPKCGLLAIGGSKVALERVLLQRFISAWIQQ